MNFSFSFLQDWYNEVKATFVPVVVKKGFRNLSDEQKEKIYNFMTLSKYVPIADTLCENFRMLINEYDYGQLKKIIKDREDFVNVNSVYVNVDLFKAFAIQKNEWYHKIINGDLDWDIDVGEYEEWRSELQRRVADTNLKLLKVRPSLNCVENDMINVIKNYKDGMGF